MFNFLRGIALVAAIIVIGEAAFAAEVGTADAMMPACRMAVGMQPNGPTNQFTYQNSGICIGIVDGLSFQSPGICTPSGVTIAQGIRVVIKYIDDRPERLNENFKTLVLEALRAAWPCKN